MTLVKDVPSSVRLAGFECRVWYRRQPVYCPICRAIGHRVKDCPSKESAIAVASLVRSPASVATLGGEQFLKSQQRPGLLPPLLSQPVLLSEPLVLRTPTQVPPVAQSDPEFNPDVELESLDSPTEGAFSGEECSRNEEVVASQAASSSSPSSPKRKRKKKPTPPSASESSQSTSSFVPTELVPIDQVAWPPQPVDHSETPTRLLFPRTAAMQTQGKITTMHGLYRVVATSFDLGGATMHALNGRYSLEELRQAVYSLPEPNRVTAILSLLHGVDVPPLAADDPLSGFSSCPP